jgi:hypothetical protein
LFCSRCGEELDAGVSYCRACGATSEVEKLAGAVNGVVALAVRPCLWALAFVCVATLLVVVGLADYAIFGAAFIYAAWAVLRRRG